MCVLVFGGAEGIRTPDPLHAMQVRYQLRHSPRSGAARVRATRGILADGPHRLLIGGRVPSSTGREVVRREPQPPGRRARPPPPSRSWPSPRGCRRPRAASRAAPAMAIRREAPCITSDRRSPPERGARAPHGWPGTMRSATSSSGLGPGSLDVGVGVPGERGVLAESLGELLAGQAGALADVVLAQAWVLARRSGRSPSPGRRPSRAARARSLVTSSDGVAGSATTAAIVLGLPAPGVVEADVGVALRPAVGVPGGLAVPHAGPAAGRRRGLSGHGRR